MLKNNNNNGNINKTTDQIKYTPMSSPNEKQNVKNSKNLDLNESNVNNESSPSNSNIRPSSGLFAIAMSDGELTNELNQSPSKQLLKPKQNDQIDQHNTQLVNSTSVDQDILFSSAPSSPIVSIDNLTNVLESSIDDDAKMIAKRTTPQPSKKNSIANNLTPIPSTANLNGVVGSQGKDLNTKEKHKKPWYSVSIDYLI